MHRKWKCPFLDNVKVDVVTFKYGDHTHVRVTDIPWDHQYHLDYDKSALIGACFFNIPADQLV